MSRETDAASALNIDSVSAAEKRVPANRVPLPSFGQGRSTASYSAASEAVEIRRERRIVAKLDSPDAIEKFAKEKKLSVEDRTMLSDMLQRRATIDAATRDGQDETTGQSVGSQAAVVGDSPPASAAREVPGSDAQAIEARQASIEARSTHHALQAAGDPLPAPEAGFVPTPDKASSEDERVLPSLSMGPIDLRIDGVELRAAFDREASAIHVTELDGTLRQALQSPEQIQEFAAENRLERGVIDSLHDMLPPTNEAIRNALAGGSNTVELDDRATEKAAAPASLDESVLRWTDAKWSSQAAQNQARGPESPLNEEAAPKTRGGLDVSSLPDELDERYTRIGKSFYHAHGSAELAFVDFGKSLKTTSNSPAVAADLLAVARARGWKKIKATGTEEFRRQIWLQGTLRGLEVQGYRPNEQDQAALRNAMRDDQKFMNAVAPVGERANRREQGASQDGANVRSTADGVSPGLVGDIVRAANGRAEDAAKAARNMVEEKMPRTKADPRAREVFETQSPEAGVREIPSLINAYAVDAAVRKFAAENIGNEAQAQRFVMLARSVIAERLENGIEIPQVSVKNDRGIVIDHGPANYRRDPDEKMSYYLKLRQPDGSDREVWGKGLEKAIHEGGIQLGDYVSARRTGSKEVEVTANVRNESGKVVGQEPIVASRNEWEVTQLPKVRDLSSVAER